MLKKLYSTILCCIFGTFLFAQSSVNYQNQWIDYSKTYYKFMIGPFGYDIVGAPVPAGVVRIPQSTLAANGLANITAGQFQLWHNGVQIPIYTSAQSGILSASDYIEFWGQINDGSLDQYLYPDSSYQFSKHWSLQTDSAAYYLTYSTSGVNARYVPTANNAAQSTLTPDKNFTYTQGRYYHASLNPGYSVILDGENLYSSTYDIGEMWVSRPATPDACGCTGPIPQYFDSLRLDTTGPPMTARLSVIGGLPNTRQVEISLNNDSLAQFEMDYYSDSLITIPNIPVSDITGDEAAFLTADINPNPYDEIFVNIIELDYPHLFNFGNATSFAFTLAPSMQPGSYIKTGRLINITNFNSSTAAPVLYDMANGTRYVGDISVPGTISFLLTPSTQSYNLVLVRGDGSTATTVSSLQQRNFVDYSQASNQGNYLIISNPEIYGSGSSNYVQQYQQYRSSSVGGGYNAQLIDINEITDQFAWGVKKHPLSIKNFLQYARNNFTIKPSFVFLIGKGVTYDNYEVNETDPLIDQLDVVPTWGYPGSDNLLSSSNYTAIPSTPIGRLSAVSAQEVGNYLQKIKQYETAQKDTVQTIANKSWMKTVLQLTGADDPSIGPILDKYMANYKTIISDTLFGGNVVSFSKSANPSGYSQEVVNFTNTFNAGSGLITYFGHSSTTNLDFNLADPSNYSNTGRYPMFIANGCLAGNIFDYDVDRLNVLSSISEKFVLEPSVGSIAFLATSSFSITNYLNIFTTKFYDAMSRDKYGKSFGLVTQEGITKGLTITGLTDFYGKIHAEQYTLHGDPAFKMNYFSKPDYVIDSTQMFISPGYVSVGDSSFNVKVKIYNIGEAANDSVHFSLQRKYPNGQSATVFSQWFPTINSLDSVTVTLPIVPDRDKGTEQITATINDLHTVQELDSLNNSGTITFSINNTDIRPIYPFNYSIVNTSAVNLFASTENPLAPSATYTMQIDTTALFNSPVLKTMSVTSTGGVLKFNNLSLPLDSTVYYWRVSNNAQPVYWNTFSFTYTSTGTSGFEQDHLYQNTQSSFTNISLDSTSRQYSFAKGLTNVFVEQTIYPTGGDQDNQFSVSVNGSFITESACVGSSIIFNVFDTLTFSPWANLTDPFGAAPPCLPDRLYNFEYSTLSPDQRDSAVQFFNSIPNGDYVIAREIYNIGDADWAPTVWAADTALYGAGNSLYDVLKAQGVPIDSFYFPRTFIFLFRKNDSTHFTPLSALTEGVYDAITLSDNISTTDTLGNITSPVFGPGLAWDNVVWNGYAPNSNNIVSVNVIGIKNNGAQKVLDTLSSGEQSLDISTINANTYRYLQLRLNTQDSVTALPYQLQNWGIQYSPAPEGGVAPNLGYSIPDTVTYKDAVNTAYDTLSGYVVFKNVSATKFKPISLSLILYDANNNADTFALPKTKAVAAGDTIKISYSVNAEALPAGIYNLLLLINPSDSQPEQYLFNNSIYKYILLQRNVGPAPQLGFTAVPINNTVNGQWNVMNEAADVSYYQLQHSTDAVNFNMVGNVKAQAGSEATKSYNLIHENPIDGKNYYRVKIVKDDSIYSYSNIKEVDFGTDIQIYPNPFVSKVNISVCTQTPGTYTVRIVNGAGQQVMEKTFSGAFTTLDLSGLSTGSYIAIVDDGTHPKSFKLQKQN
jgi:hypothetical protein